ASPKIIKLREEPSEYTEAQRGKSPAINSTLVPVKGILNLGNTCFFNAVMQNLSQTHMLIDLIQEVKEKGYKLKICPSVETNLSPLTVILSSPDPLTAAMIHFLQSMKEPGKGPVNPKVLFNQLCQKAWALVFAWTGAKLCVSDGQHHTLSGAREGPSLYPVYSKASQQPASS
ncbi:Ubiquitin carboxyl-terminal hydrolase 45, partial [Ilyodon furcidens]